MSKVILILASVIGLSSFAANCPDLSGFYWDIPSDKPDYVNFGRMTEFRQVSCEKIVIYIHTVDENGNDVYPVGNGYTWNLGLPACSRYQPGIDCRAHPYTEKVVSTVEQGKLKDTQQGFCSYSKFDLALDNKGNMIDTTPVICDNGFSGILTRIIERAR